MMKNNRRKVYKRDCGMCLTDEQLTQENAKIAYLLREDGILFIVGNCWLLGGEDQQRDRVDENTFNKPQFVSQFKDMDFHTAVIYPGVPGLGEGCFSNCKGLKKMIVHNRGLFIHTHCAEGSSLGSISQRDLEDTFGLASHQNTPSFLNNVSNLEIDDFNEEDED